MMLKQVLPYLYTKTLLCKTYIFDT